MEPSRTDFDAWMRERQQRTESVLDALLPAALVSPARLHEAMRYAVLGGGKRVRPLLAFAAGELGEAPLDRVDRAAAAVELIHAYSLVHDDLPCMDDDVLRRGRPTCHVAFGEATALLAGDALQSQAFAMLAAAPMREAARACALLASASGVAGMAGGQAIDLASTGCSLTESELETMHKLKTGALIRAAARLGALAGRPIALEAEAAIDAWAGAAGLAFQVVDDVLDVEGSTATLGKTAGKDAAQGKPTYVSLLGLAAAKAKAATLAAQARSALAPFGARGARLCALSDDIVGRTH